MNFVPGIGPATEVAALLMLLALTALVVFRYTEGSRRSAQRRTNKAAAGTVSAAGFGIVGVLAAISGAADAGADVLGGVFGYLGAHPTFFTQLSLGGLAWGVAEGAVALSPSTVALIAGVIILVGIGLSRS